MPFNGSGVYAAPASPGAFNPAVSGSGATPSAWNTLLDDIETALSTCVTKDGQTTVTADIPMNSHKITGLADGTAATDAMAYGQRPGATSGNATTFMAANTALATGGSTTDLCNTGSIGASGQVWLIGGSMNFQCTGGATVGTVAIYNGSAYIAGGEGTTPAANQNEQASTPFAVVTLTGATTFTLRGAATVANSFALTSGTIGTIAPNKYTGITAVRIA